MHDAARTIGAQQGHTGLRELMPAEHIGGELRLQHLARQVLHGARLAIGAVVEHGIEPAARAARYLFGSGMPVVGYYRGSTRDLFLAEQRNQFRLPSYQRADVRLNKSWQRDRVRWTLFAEVINVLNRRNLKPDELAGFDARTGRVRLAFNRMFPVLPSAGVLAEF